MTKNKFAYIFDKVFWYAVSLLPIVFLAIFAFKGQFADFPTMLTQFVGQFPTGDLVSGVFVNIWQIISGMSEFALGANFPSILIYLCSYLVYAELFHLLVDFLLFIPNLCHKFMDFLTKK